MLRFRLFSFRAFFALFTGAKSTRWPGASHFAVHILCFCFLIAIALFATNIALGVTLLHIGNTVLCRDYDEGLGYEDDVRTLPVTFANKEAWGKGSINYISIHENKTRAQIFASSLVPSLLIIHIMIVHICLHFRGISNRVGMLLAACLIMMFILVNTQEHWLDIDAGKLHSEYDWCWRSNKEMIGLWAERMARWRLLVVAEVLSGVGGLCIALYSALAITAATTNRARSQRQSTRLQNLRSTLHPSSASNNEASDDSSVTIRGAGIPSVHLSLPANTRSLLPSSLAANTPADKSGLTVPLSTVKRGEHNMTEIENREREHMNVKGEADENPFADPEIPVRIVRMKSVAKPGAAIQDPKAGEWRKDSTR